MISYAWHPQRKRWRYALALFLATLAALVFLAPRTAPEFWPRFIAFWFSFVSIALFIEQETRIDKNKLVLIREGRLFGRFRVWLRQYPLSEFTQVAMERVFDPEGPDNVLIGLRRGNGRLMAISYFLVDRNKMSVEAERFAQSLAETTGLPLDESF